MFYFDSYVHDNSILGDEYFPNTGKLLNPMAKSSYKLQQMENMALGSHEILSYPLLPFHH